MLRRNLLVSTTYDIYGVAREGRSMSTPQENERDQEQIRRELERLSEYNGVLRMMLRHSLPLDRDTYIRMAGLDPTEEVGAETAPPTRQ